MQSHFIRINRCYDSHVHWLGHGQIENTISLHHLKSTKDLFLLSGGHKNFSMKAMQNLMPQSFRKNWFMGFGWDNNLWISKETPHRKHLDQLSKENPICFLRADGHGFWVNTKALEVCGLLSLSREKSLLKKGISLDKKYCYEGLKEQGAVFDENQELSGVFLDDSMKLIRKFIPERGDKQVQEELLRATNYFLKNGFTHIRDVGCNDQQWEQAMILSQKGKLDLFAEVFFNCSSADKVDQIIKSVEYAKKHQPFQLRVKGVKIFYDGALGSEGAYLSECYQSGSGCGSLLMTDNQLESVLQMCWEKELEVALHTIGDEAAHRAMIGAHKMYKKGLDGVLNLEHVQILRPETVALMKNKKIFCHMQPCHWLDDKKWLFDKISKTLHSFVFPWKALEEAGVSVFFGSDTPIARPSISLNYQAFQDANRSGIPSTQNFFSHHEHPDILWGKDINTVFNQQGVLEKVYF